MASKLDIADTKAFISETESDIIKWMFIFWVGSIAATLGGIISTTRFMIINK